MTKKRNLIGFHLYNDFSGSPKVLATVLLGLAQKGYEIKLLTSKNGALDSIISNKNITIKEVPYKFHADSSVRTIMSFLWANIRYFFFILSSPKKNKVVYVNTIMPWGAALGAFIRRMPVVYHYHENALIKGKAYHILSKVMEKLAHSIICVSKTQAATLERTKNVFIVSNGLTQGFLSKLNPDPYKAFEAKKILMLASLKTFKGVNEFCELAKMMPQYNFILVLNDSEKNCKIFEEKNCCRDITNLSIHSRSTNVAEFYNQSSVIVNLSDKRKFVETFGMTIIEGMAAGLPAIVPTVGGPAELVREGYNGFLADIENLHLIKEKIEYIFSSQKIYIEMSRNAHESVKEFTDSAMIEEISKIIDSTANKKDFH